MLSEIYCRNSSDPNYNPKTLVTASVLEGLLTKIRMIIFTERGEILGVPGLGLNLEDHLFELNANVGQIQKSFYDQLTAFAPEAGRFNVTIEVNFQPGVIRDVCFIDIFVDGTKLLGVLAK